MLNRLRSWWHARDPWAGPPVELPVPHLRQEPWLCVPTSVAMVLAFDGAPRPPREIKCLAAGRAWDPEAPFDDHTITLFDDLCRGLATIGVHWREETFANTEAGFAQGLARIAAHLRRGRPVLADTALLGGHTLVICGIDPAARTLIARDPDRDAPGRRVFGADEFRGLWHSQPVGFDGRGAIFTTPPRPANVPGSASCRSTA